MVLEKIVQVTTKMAQTCIGELLIPLELYKGSVIPHAAPGRDFLCVLWIIGRQ